MSETDRVTGNREAAAEQIDHAARANGASDEVTEQQLEQVRGGATYLRPKPFQIISA